VPGGDRRFLRPAARFRPRAWRALAASGLTLLAACGGGPASPGGRVEGNPPPVTRPTLAQTYRPSGHAAAGDVFVHLFEWKWTDIATECEARLGPEGFTAVQVSPPEEHSITPNHDWSERYQPVSYSIDRSRSGTRAEFIDMVNRCKAAGVGIYVDAVINHMTNFPSPGTGSNGTNYTKYEYPGLYTQSDFHTPCTVSNYADAANVQDCELFGLPDLNTGSATVRQKIADYLIMLARLGVAGFRIDAAKHIQQVELDKIIALVDSTMSAEAKPVPYWFLEVSAGFGEALRPADYFGEGYSSGGSADITEFIFKGVADKFTKLGGTQHLFQLNPNGTPGNQFSPNAWGMMPSDKAVVFLQNHDTQHDLGSQCGLRYTNPQVFRLANVWMLAQPYGYPSVLSGYAFSCDQNGITVGPPSDANGWTLPVSCASNLESATIGQWVCEHRDPYISSMVAFRHEVAGTDLDHWWDNGADAIAFSRGDKGFVAINRESSQVTATVPTGMAPGTYCDVITGGRSGAACAGASVVVDASGAVALTLAANSAVAVLASTKL
jgi:alpha-amylase